MEEFQKKLGYTFKDPRWLHRALTHKSCGEINNERLEFLGDSVLNFVAADVIYETYPTLSEGQMSRMRAALVREDTLALIATKLQLKRHLHYIEDFQRPVAKAAVLADALEAVFGAIYKEAGIETVHKVIRLHLLRVLAEGQAPIRKDNKTALQEYLQARGHKLPQYEMVRMNEAADEDRRVEARCIVLEGVVRATGHGRTRKAAELEAAGKALKMCKERDASPRSPSLRVA